MLSRHTRLLVLLQEMQETTVGQLVGDLGVSAATVRRDLKAMEEKGLLARTPGGARYLSPASLVSRTFEEKRSRMRAEKEQIACAAGALVEPGMVVALDSGTTVWRVAAALRDMAPLTVLTAALAPVEELGAVEGIGIHLVGGRFRGRNLDFVGSATVAAFDRFSADLAIIGGDGLRLGRGVYSTDEEGAEVVSALAGCARRRVVVMDHTKLDARAPWLALPFESIDVLITDDGVGKETLPHLEAEPYEVILATK